MEQRPENYKKSYIDENNPEVSRPAGSSFKAAVAVLSAIALILAVVLGFILYNNNKLVSELNAEKADLTEQIQNLQNDYNTLSSDYESINAQLDSSREEVNQLVERIKKTNATNRAKIRQYQKELGTLRTIMRNYIVQIDSLNTLNHKLSAEAKKARKEAAAERQKNEELQKTVSDLSGKVESGAVIRGRNIHADAYNKHGKVVDRSASTNYVIVSLSLVENILAEKGPLRVYVVVTDPDGNILKNDQSGICNFNGQVVETSASREIDYQGTEIEVGIYLKDIEKYAKGIYTVRVLTEMSELGQAQFMLR